MRKSEPLMAYVCVWASQWSPPSVKTCNVNLCMYVYPDSLLLCTDDILASILIHIGHVTGIIST